jgi:F420-dependent oxidoreductase-like protein
MRFSIWPGPGNTWQDTLALAAHAESSGWDGIWYADHFMPNAADTSGPTNEAWTTIAGLAAAVPRIRIGTLVTGNTYRHPAVLAKMAAGVDIISGGRLVLGLGSGWQENEHQAYGIPFHTVGGRLNRLEEACEVITSLFKNEKTTFEGRYYQLTDAPLAPKPVQQPVPILIGGGGEQKTLRIAAKYANEWNVWGPPELLKQKMEVLDRHCQDLGRNPKEIKRSAQNMLFMGDDAETMEKAKAMGARAWAGGKDQLQEIMGRYQDIGLDEIIVPDFTLGRSLEHKKETYDRFINDVAKPFR